MIILFPVTIFLIVTFESLVLLNILFFIIYINFRYLTLQSVLQRFFWNMFLYRKLGVTEASTADRLLGQHFLTAIEQRKRRLETAMDVNRKPSNSVFLWARGETIGSWHLPCVKLEKFRTELSLVYVWSYFIQNWTYGVNWICISVSLSAFNAESVFVVLSFQIVVLA